MDSKWMTMDSKWMNTIGRFTFGRSLTLGQ